MSVDEPIGGLRDQLVRGAKHRRRVERRNRIVGGSLALVVLVAGLGALLSSRNDDTAINVGPASRQGVVAACDALADVHSARNSSNEAQGEETEARFREAAAASGDKALAALGRRVAAGNVASYNAAMQRCRQMQAPAFTPRYVPARSSGPQPSVQLSDYGTVQELEPFADDPPAELTNMIVGRNLSRVEAAHTDTGAYFARWSYDDPANQRVHCYTITDPRAGGSSGCGRERQGPGPHQSTSYGPTYSFPPSDVSFLVLQTQLGAYVQRPASGISVFSTGKPVNLTGSVLSYDAYGNQLSCRSISTAQTC